MTNDRKHRKECPGGNSWQSREESRGEPLFDGRSLPVAGKKLGIRTSNLDGVKGGGMCGRECGLNSGESLCGSGKRILPDKSRYKPPGESHDEAVQEVGDGHMSEDGKDNKTFLEQRAISPDTPSNAGTASANARKAKNAPKKLVAVLRDRLYESAKSQPERRYGQLYDKVWRPDVLRESWRRVSGNHGSAGVDGISINWIRDYGVERFLEELGSMLRSKDYSPGLIRRAFIEKADGRMRPLGIPTVADRVVQMAVKLVIEPLFEADFLSCSFGFRPGRSSHQAIGLIDDHLKRGYRWVIDIDLKSYFDTIPHEALLKLVQRRLIDRNILRLIRRWLKAGVLHEGRVEYPELGSPQGGVLSPLLANIYLHEVDREWQSRRPRAVLVRYADDMLILCPTEADALKEFDHLKSCLRRLELTLNSDKTRIVQVRDGFDFLGFSYHVGFYTRHGKQQEIMIKVPRRKSEQGMRDKIKFTVKSLRLGNPLEDSIQQINQMLRGWANYFRVCNMGSALIGLVRHACVQLRLYLRRRFHRKRCQHGKRWPDRIFHSTYGLFSVSDLLNRRCTNANA